MFSKQAQLSSQAARSAAQKRRERRKKLKEAKIIVEVPNVGPRKVGTKPSNAPPKKKALGRRRTAAEPPRKMTVEGQLDLDKKLTYGPPIAYDHRGSVGDARVVVRVAAATQTNLANILCGVLAFAQTRLTLNSDPIKWNYAYKFLFEWIKAKWAGKTVTYDLKEAPAVIWDIVHAGSSRRKGKVSVIVEESTEVLAEPTTAATGNCPMGPQATQTGIGNKVIDVVLSSYTEALGYKYTSDLFARCGEVLDVVPSSYRRIKENDLSLFTSTSALSSSLVCFGFHVSNGIAFNNAQEVYTLEKPECEWLSRLVMFADALEIVGGSGLTTTCSPAAIVVDRMMQKLRGYEAHSRNVLLKPIDFYPVMLALDNVLAEAVGRFSGGTPSKATLFANAGFNLYDYRYIMYVCILRWCSSWVPICAGYQFAFPDGSNLRNAISVGTGSTPTRLAEQLHMIEPFEKALSHLYPYFLKSKNLMVYPVPYFSTNFSASSNGWTFNGTGFLSAWSFLTNLSTTYEIAAFSTINAQTLFQRWNSAMEYFQQSIPSSTRKEESPINLTVMTRRHDPVAPTAALGIYSFGNIPDHVNQMLDGAILPQIYKAESASGVFTNFYQTLTGETNYEGYSIVSNFSGNSADVTSLLQAAWYPSVHLLGGAGDAEAIVDDDEEEIVEKKAEEEEIKKEAEKKDSEGLLPKATDLLEKGFEVINDETTKQALTTFLTLMKAATI